jgi:lysyl endopeptidase
MSYGNVETEDQIAGKPDITLVEIDEPIPPSYGLFLNGWGRRDVAPSEAVSIHHPSTHGKRITFERDSTSITGFNNPSNDTHIRVDWDEGTTERGSSGSPLFNSAQQTVGVLSGGESGCEIRDWYGRLHNAWDGGGTPDTQLRPWLDPTDTEPETVEGRALADDTIPPAPVNLSVEDVTSTSVRLQWTAPGDDGMDGTVDRYLLRYRASAPERPIDAPIETQDDFEVATQVSSVPSPAPAGTIQSATVDVSEDSSYYFALVAVDEVLNASPLAAVDRDVTPVNDLQVTAPAPNPARDQTRLRVVTEERRRVQVRLYDALGRRVSLLLDDEIDPYRGTTVPIDVSSLSSGMYFARIRVADGRIQTRKISVVR